MGSRGASGAKIPEVYGELGPGGLPVGAGEAEWVPGPGLACRPLTDPVAAGQGPGKRAGVGWPVLAEPRDTAPAHLARWSLSPGSQETESFTWPAVHGHRWLHSSQSAAGLRARLCRLQQLPSL